jgi:hypothetical protein
MKNTFQFNEINGVDLGDDSLTANPTPGSGVSTSTKCTLDEHVNIVSPVVVESGDVGVVVQSRAGSGSGTRAGVGVKVGQQPSKKRKGKRLLKSGMNFLLLQ